MALQKIPGRAIQLDSQANSDVMYFDGTDWVRLEKGDAGKVLTVNEDATAPQWGPACVFPGTQFGYVCGGYLGKSPDDTSGPNVHYGISIHKFSLTTDGDSTLVGDLLSARRQLSGFSSNTHGFSVGGYISQAPSSLDIIERFSFTTDGNSTDWADLTTTFNTNAVPASSCTHGYSFGGENGTNANTNIIDRFPFASQTNSTDIGNLVLVRSGGAGVSSETDGYIVGGVTVGTNPGNSAPLWDRSNIDKFSFASGTQNAVDHGDLPLELSAGAHNPSGISGETHGYCAGGIFSRNVNNHQWPREQIEKFSYASNVTASDVGDLVQAGTNNPSGPNFGVSGASGHQY